MFANRLQCEVRSWAAASVWSMSASDSRDDICSAYGRFSFFCFYFELVEWLKLNPFKLAFFSVSLLQIFECKLSRWRRPRATAYYSFANSISLFFFLFFRRCNYSQSQINLLHIHATRKHTGTGWLVAAAAPNIRCALKANKLENYTCATKTARNLHLEKSFFLLCRFAWFS